MNFTGTLIGAVLGMWLTHNLLGALVGGALGFMFDASRQQQRRRTPTQGGYVAPLFALIGAVAKADGRVSEGNRHRRAPDGAHGPRPGGPACRH